MTDAQAAKGHTALPWRYGGDSQYPCSIYEHGRSDVSAIAVTVRAGTRSDEEGAANAALIVERVNKGPAADAMVEALTRLRKTAAMLHQNAVGCAIEHYGADFQQQGLPGWLDDAQADIDAACQALTAYRGEA